MKYPTKPPTLSIALALSGNTTITHLNLRECDIFAEGEDQFSTYLRSTTSLQHLDLSQNKIGLKELMNLGKLNIN